MMYCNIWSTRLLESFALARGMHSPQATGRALSIHPDIVRDKLNYWHVFDTFFGGEGARVEVFYKGLFFWEVLRWRLVICGDVVSLWGEESHFGEYRVFCGGGGGGERVGLRIYCEGKLKYFSRSKIIIVWGYGVVFIDKG